MTVAANNSRLDDSEATTDWVSITKAVSLESNFFYQGSNSIANDKGATGVYGAALADTVTTDLATGTYDTVIFKLFTYAPGLIETRDLYGMDARIGSSSGDYYRYPVHGNETYPATKSWVIVPINPNLVAYRGSTTGTPALGSCDYYGGSINATASAKIGAFGIDAVDVGSGLTFTGTGGSYQSFIDYDEGTANNRFGYVLTIDEIIYAVGTLIVKPDASGTFSDSNRTIVYPSGMYDTGFPGHEIDLTNTSIVTLDSMTYIGAGTGAIIQEFHTNDDVDGTNEEVDIIGHGYLTGDYVGYSKQGGTDSMGLTDATNYWVNAVTDDSIAFYTTLINAIADTSRVGLTASGGSETHRLTKQIDHRPDYIVSNTIGSSTLDGNTYLNHRNVTFTSAASQDGGRIECKLLTQNSADIENVTIVTSADPSVACLQDPIFGTTTDLHDSTFVQGSLGEVGHAIEIDTATTYTFTNLFFSGYGATTSDQAALDVTAGSGTVTITISGGDTPTYKTAGATVVINSDVTVTFANLKDNSEVRIYENISVEDTDISFSATNTIASLGSGFGDFTPGDIVRISGSDSNDGNYALTSASASTLGVTPTTITNESAGATVKIKKIDQTQLAGIEDATAGSPDARTFAASVASGTLVDYVIHNFQPGDEIYQTIRVIDFTWPSTTQTIVINQQIDRNAEN